MHLSLLAGVALAAAGMWGLFQGWWGGSTFPPRNDVYPRQETVQTTNTNMPGGASTTYNATAPATTRQNFMGWFSWDNQFSQQPTASSASQGSGVRPGIGGKAQSH